MSQVTPEFALAILKAVQAQPKQIQYQRCSHFRSSLQRKATTSRADREDSRRQFVQTPTSVLTPVTKTAERSLEFQRVVAVEELIPEMSFANETQKHKAIRNCSEPLAQPRYVETAAYKRI